MKGLTKIVVVLIAVTLFSVTGFAASQAVNATSVAPTLHVSVNVQTAMSLTLATGAAAGSCAVTSPGPGGEDFAINLGNVNALGIPNGANCSTPLGSNATGAV